MSVMFQVHLPTNKDITTYNIITLCWTSFALCTVVFSYCDADYILTKARVSDQNTASQRQKLKALHIMCLS